MVKKIQTCLDNRINRLSYVYLYAMGKYLWRPETLLNFSQNENGPKFAVVVLNRPICGDAGYIESLWNHGEFDAV